MGGGQKQNQDQVSAEESRLNRFVISGEGHERRIEYLFRAA